MATPRIHIPPEQIAAGEVTLDRAQSHYLVTVRRLRGGAPVVVFDGAGGEFDAVLVNGRRTDPSRLLIRGPRGAAAPGPSVTLVQALIKNRNFDLVVRKAAELGAARLVPVRTARSVKEAAAGVARWRTIAAEASRQCRRADVMAVDDVAPFSSALSVVADLKIIAHGDTGTPIAGVLENAGAGPVAAAVGPEGGFTEHEVEQAEGAGFVAVSLGRRTLRSETVPLVLLAVIQYARGDLGGR